MATSDIYATGFDEESTGECPADECPECDGTLVTIAGETCCDQCGLIIEAARIDRQGERTFEADEYPHKRTGTPLTNTRHDRGLSTEIGRNTDARGNTLSGRKRQQLTRLRREHRRGRWGSKAERNLGHGCTEIARLTAALGLDRSLREQACTLFRTAQDADLLRGRSIEAMATACVYAACRCAKRTRTVDDLTTVARVGADRIQNSYLALQRGLDLQVPPQEPAAFVPKLATAVAVPPETRCEALRVAEQVQDRGLASGRHPSGMAAGCLAVAADRLAVDVRQTALADAADVTPTTVRTNRDLIRERLGDRR